MGLELVTLASDALGGGRIFCRGGSGFTADWQKVSDLY